MVERAKMDIGWRWGHADGGDNDYSFTLFIRNY